MRILAAGDIHNDSRLSEKLAEKATKENVDLVILCGDLTMNDEPARNIIAPFIKAHKKVLLIPGNHETVATADFLAEVYENTKNIHGYSVKYDDVGIFGCGGANIGLFQLQEDEIFDLLKQGNDKIEYLKKKIMVSHVHPKGGLMEKFTDIFPGSSGVTKAIETFKPDIVLCSHVHEAEGIEEMVGKTKVINVGKAGKIIDI
ncbi:metallophosphoesterase family protein [Candidatus Woesearchaeota archaeon]|nr:metallophosphoesterase family protein [Candidatus Woesearchaeota archaeon]